MMRTSFGLACGLVTLLSEATPAADVADEVIGQYTIVSVVNDGQGVPEDRPQEDGQEIDVAESKLDPGSDPRRIMMVATGVRGEGGGRGQGPGQDRGGLRSPDLCRRGQSNSQGVRIQAGQSTKPVRTQEDRPLTSPEDRGRPDFATGGVRRPL